MEKKTFELEIKELDEEGTFSGYLSTFGNIDSGGDVVEKGAFKKTLRENKAFAFTWGHDASLEGIIGSFSAKEDDKGLFVNGSFFLDLDVGNKAYRTAKALQEKGVRLAMSIGYKTIKHVYDTVNGITIRRLKEIDLHEGAATLFPMNDATKLTVKEINDNSGREMKPYPNEHACRLNDPGKYQRFARMKRKHDGKEYYVIIGFKKGGGSEDQAYRYPKDTWSASEARAHCQEKGGSFEAATGKELIVVCKSCGETMVLTEPVDATQPGAEKSNVEPAESHSAEMRILSPVIEGLEKKKTRPQRLLEQMINTLEKS